LIVFNINIGLDGLVGFGFVGGLFNRDSSFSVFRFLVTLFFELFVLIYYKNS
jgi:hypothetical protein